MRRRVALAVAAVVAGAVLVGAQQQVQPTITIDPTCDDTRPAAWTIAVNGRMPHPGNRFRIVFDYGGPNPTSAGSGNVQSDFTYSDTIGVKTQPHTGTSFTVAAFEDQGNGPIAGTLATTTFRSPCPTRTTTSSSSSSSSSTSSSTSSTTTTTTVPVSVATLTVTPPLGPPGFVTSAHGAGFPPGPVGLAWSPGLGGASATADAAGTFTVPVLVLRKDVVGPRTLTAVGGTVTASTAFLVVPAPAQPRRFVARR